MTFVSARGAQFHIVDLGEAGRPVVMLHGLFTGSVASWYLTAAPTLARSHRIRLIDWRAHGLTERTPSGYSSMEMAEDLADLTADLGPFALVAHSFGAIVAARFGLANPGRVTELVLVEPPVIDSGRPWWTNADTVRTRSDLAAAGSSRRGAAVARTLDETTILADLENEPAFTKTDVRALPNVPVMLIVGDESPYQAAARELASERPDIQIEVLRGGHEIHVDAKVALTELLERFLDGADV